MLLLLAIPCFASEPKFHFMDCVRVTRGFYRSCTGTIESWNGSNKYNIQSNDCRGESIYAQLEENDLELSKGCSK